MSVHPGGLLNRLIRFRGARAISFLLIAGGIFAAIAVSINLPLLNEIDHSVTHFLQHYRTAGLDVFFFAFSFLGNSLVVMLLAAAVAIALWRHGHPRAGLLVLLSLLSLPMNVLLKDWAVRPRPTADAVLILLPRVGMSFPSGHAMGSTVVYGFLAALAWMRLPPSRLRTGLTSTLAALPLPIGLSRIYVGAHWLSDVVAGIAAGAFLLVPLVGLYRRWHRPAEN
jgi:undecaprenyl-diphosphatase